MRIEIQDPIPTRESLLNRLKDWEDNDSWKLFFQTYWLLIYNFAIRKGLNHEEAEEVVQETTLAVAKSIASFEYDPGRCAFKTWLLTVTRSKIARQFDKRPQHAPAPSIPPAGSTLGVSALGNTAAPDDWESFWEEQWHKNLLDAAIDRVKARVPIEHFQMFDLFVVKGWTARDVARTLGVTVAHVYVAKHRLSKLIRKEVELLETKGF